MSGVQFVIMANGLNEAIDDINDKLGQIRESHDELSSKLNACVNQLAGLGRQQTQIFSHLQRFMSAAALTDGSSSKGHPVRVGARTLDHADTFKNQRPHRDHQQCNGPVNIDAWKDVTELDEDPTVNGGVDADPINNSSMTESMEPPTRKRGRRRERPSLNAPSERLYNAQDTARPTSSMGATTDGEEDFMPAKRPRPERVSLPPHSPLPGVGFVSANASDNGSDDSATVDYAGRSVASFGFGDFAPLDNTVVVSSSPGIGLDPETSADIGGSFKMRTHQMQSQDRDHRDMGSLRNETRGRSPIGPHPRDLSRGWAMSMEEGQGQSVQAEDAPDKGTQDERPSGGEGTKQAPPTAPSHNYVRPTAR